MTDDKTKDKCPTCEGSGSVKEGEYPDYYDVPCPDCTDKAEQCSVDHSTMDALIFQNNLFRRQIADLKAENERLTGMLLEAVPILDRHANSECLGPKSLITRIQALKAGE